MSTAILQKCLDELNKDGFRKDYVIGMLETLIAITHEPLPANLSQNVATQSARPIAQTPEPITDADNAFLNAYANGTIGGLTA